MTNALGRAIIVGGLGLVVGANVLSGCAPQQPVYQAVCVNPFTHEALDSELFCHAGFGEFVFVDMSGGYHQYAARTIVTNYVTETRVRNYEVQYPPKFTPAPKQVLAGKKATVYDPNKKAGTKLTGARNVVKTKKPDPAWGTAPDPKKRQPSKIQDRPYKPSPVKTYKPYKSK